jgi:hypothetical protein
LRRQILCCAFLAIDHGERAADLGVVVLDGFENSLEVTRRILREAHFAGSSG